MPAAQVIVEIGEIFQKMPAETRAARLRRVTDLFLGRLDDFQAAHIELFDRIFAALIENIEEPALAELSRRMATVDKAPVKLIGWLSRHDDLAIASPVLSRSPRLHDAVLVDIARTKSQDHLVAIAGRRQVSEPVSDVLIDRGDSRVLTRIAGNSGATFSKDGYRRLLASAGQDADVAQALIARRDLPPEMFKQLVLEASFPVQQRLMMHANPTLRERIKETLGNFSRQTMEATPPTASSRIALRVQQSPTDEFRTTFSQGVTAGKLTESVGALARLTDLPVEVIKRLVRQNDIESLLILCRACEVHWPTASSFMKLIASGNSDQILKPCFETYTKMAAVDAQRALRLLRHRNDASRGDLKKALIDRAS